MNKNILISIIVVGGVIFGGWFLSKPNQQSNNYAAVNNPINTSGQKSEAEVAITKIEVVHFHGTHQCWSCTTVGEYALKTIKEKFPEEYADGTIIFKDINGELPENRDIVMKYQARGSSLFINSITDGKDKIEEDTIVWRLVRNEKQFVSYFEDKLNKLLGK